MAFLVPTTTFSKSEFFKVNEQKIKPNTNKSRMLAEMLLINLVKPRILDNNYLLFSYI